VGERKKGQLVREFSAGGAVFKKKGPNYLWLMVRPAGSTRWQLPKGKIDPDETSEKAAAREVKEEGGVTAKPLKKIGSSQYFFFLKGKRIFKTVTYFLMEYLRNSQKGHDHEVEETRFLPLTQALEKLTFEDDRKILQKAETSLKEGIQENLI
jgi:8-oxo-dGTP pyrophosphatase MutT (NUDIX family)